LKTLQEKLDNFKQI